MNYSAALFINQTPYRWFPFEHHTTGLWFVNYVPDRLTHFLARHLSKVNPEVNLSSDWNVLLRAGIRGGTEASVLRNIRRAGLGRATVVQPKNQDRAAYWLSSTDPGRHRPAKEFVAKLFRISDKMLGTVPSINLDVVIRKDHGTKVNAQN